MDAVVPAGARVLRQPGIILISTPVTGAAAAATTQTQLGSGVPQPITDYVPVPPGVNVPSRPGTTLATLPVAGANTGLVNLSEQSPPKPPPLTPPAASTETTVQWLGTATGPGTSLVTTYFVSTATEGNFLVTRVTTQGGTTIKETAKQLTPTSGGGIQGSVLQRLRNAIAANPSDYLSAVQNVAGNIAVPPPDFGEVLEGMGGGTAWDIRPE